MRNSTEELIADLQSTIELNAFYTENQEEFLEEEPHHYLARMLDEKHLRIKDVYYQSGMAAYCYRVFEGNRRPSRDVLLSLTRSMGLSLEQTQHALRLYQHARLDPRNRRDAAVIFAILKSLTLTETMSLLAELGEAEL